MNRHRRPSEPHEIRPRCAPEPMGVIVSHPVDWRRSELGEWAPINSGGRYPGCGCNPYSVDASKKKTLSELREDGVAPDDVGEPCLLQRLQLASKKTR